jgi:NADH dehydrogenase
MPDKRGMAGTRVIHIDDRPVRVQVGGHEAVVPTGTVLWAVGVQASSVAHAVANATGAETDRAGRIVVGRDGATA